MISFLISVAALLLGYLLYGQFVEKVFGPDPNRATPAIAKRDNVDYMPLPTWKVFMIQFLNIAGTGPIFGAIMGAKFGPSCYIWVVLGCIFAGAVHDYFSGMMSVHNGGATLPEIIGKYLGGAAKKFMLTVTVLLLVLVGTVFVYSPALILSDITGGGSPVSTGIWIAVIFAYYIFATFMPVDKLIGKIYPIFAVSLLFMVVALFVCLIIKSPSLPEFWDGLGNKGPSIGMKGVPIFPYLFITVACGAISGFHATQSPIMARCIKNEKLGRPIFYGSMITEGIVALVWAAVASYFFYGDGAEEIGASISSPAPAVVTAVAKNWLGVVGSILALLGVVAAPITSGDTAFRSARHIVSDAISMHRHSRYSKFTVSFPLFLVSGILLWFNIADEDGFNIIWRYFGWMNQTLSIFTLWAITVFLTKEKKKAYYLMSLIPACFMTSVCTTYILVDKIGFNFPNAAIPYIGVAVFVISGMLYHIWKRSLSRKA